MVRCNQFRLRSLLVMVALIATILGMAKVALRYVHTDLAWRAFPRGGALEETAESNFLNPQYEINVSNNPNMRDGDLSVFAGLTTITRLDASHTAITDRCLGDLKTLNGLRSLDISGTMISEQGVVELRVTLPQCIIQH